MFKVKAGLVIATLLLHAAPAAAQGPDGTFIVTVVNVPLHGTVNVRKQARNSAAVIGKLNVGAQTFANGQCWNSKNRRLFSQRHGMPANLTGVWCSVSTNEGDIGWVLARYLEMPGG